jgi:hypothetical protein
VDSIIINGEKMLNKESLKNIPTYRGKMIIALGFGSTVGNYPDRCDLCGRELDYSPKNLVTLDDGSKAILCICKDCRDKLYPYLIIKCEFCKYFKEDENLQTCGHCYKSYPHAIWLVAKWDSCKYFELWDGTDPEGENK